MLGGLYKEMFGYGTRTLKAVIKSIESPPGPPRENVEMLFDHLGIEHAKTTEKTKGLGQEKEVLRRAKKN